MKFLVAISAILLANCPNSALAEKPVAAINAVTIARECVLYADANIIAVVEGVDSLLCQATADALSNGEAADKVVSTLKALNAEIL